MLDSEVPSDRLIDQLGKLISLSSGNVTGLGCSRARQSQVPVAQSHLLHSMTWDENGELFID